MNARIAQLDRSKALFEDHYTVVLSSVLENIVNNINETGVKVNVDLIDQMISSKEKEEVAAEKEFKDSVTSAGYTVDISKRKDLVHWFFDILKCPVYKRGKTGPSLDDEVLTYLSDIPTAKNLMDIRKSQSYVKTLTNIKAAIKDDGRIYPQHNLNKTVSGRFSSSGKDGDKLNINGWSKEMRKIVSVTEGYRIVSFDYCNMELAVAAAMAQEVSTLKDILNKTDLHQALADRLGVPRKVGKTVNLGIQYGMTPFGIARKLGVTEEEAQTYIDGYWAQHKEIKEFKRHIIRLARKLGYVQTISGIQRKAEGCTDDQLYSTFIQGSAGDLFKKAIVNIFSDVQGINPVALMHDALVVEVKDDENFEATVADIKNRMETVHKDFVLRVDISYDEW